MNLYRVEFRVGRREPVQVTGMYATSIKDASNKMARGVRILKVERLGRQSKDGRIIWDRGGRGPRLTR